MSKRLAVSPAPGPLEAFAQAFDELFSKRNQRELFRRYLEGLLLPSERNKTLTGLANTKPVVGSVHPEAQKLQWFLIRVKVGSCSSKRAATDVAG